MPRSYTWRTYFRASSMLGSKSIRAPPCAMTVSLTPVLPKVRIGMSPAFAAAFAGGVLIAIPANAPPTKLLLRMVILLEIKFCARLQHAAYTGSSNGGEALRGPSGAIEANSGVQARKGRVV